jgi:hypothetical protein
MPALSDVREQWFTNYTGLTHWINTHAGIQVPLRISLFVSLWEIITLRNYEVTNAKFILRPRSSPGYENSLLSCCYYSQEQSPWYSRYTFYEDMLHWCCIHKLVISAAMYRFALFTPSWQPWPLDENQARRGLCKTVSVLRIRKQ